MYILRNRISNILNTLKELKNKNTNAELRCQYCGLIQLVNTADLKEYDGSWICWGCGEDQISGRGCGLGYRLP